MRDIANNIALRHVIAPIVATATQTGASINRAGFESVAFAVHVGVGGITFTGTNRIDMVAEHSNDGTTWTACTQDDVTGATIVAGGIFRSLQAAHAAPSVTKVGYVGARQFARVSAVFAGTHGTGTPVSALAILGDALNAPA